MSIYNILLSAIQSGDYTLSDMTEKITVLYAGDCLTEEARPELETAYKAYLASLTDICSRYGVTPENITSADQSQQAALVAEVTER
ncbi:MAG: hypothetical protein LUE63_10735 [Lachnospiraceae bacterium]|nr:hypothetical protein [Lachnospiraceae bacterium]